MSRNDSSGDRPPRERDITAASCGDCCREAARAMRTNTIGRLLTAYEVDCVDWCGIWCVRVRDDSGILELFTCTTIYEAINFTFVST